MAGCWPAPARSTPSECGTSSRRANGYWAGWKLARTTAQKELETLRQFFAFCFERRWATTNPAKSIKSAKNVKPEEVRLYTPDEVTRIISACDAIGRGPYERHRARAMVLLLNNTALRVGVLSLSLWPNYLE